MNDNELLDIYTDYLISSFGLTTQTGLARLLNGAISHDRIQRFLSKAPKTGKDLWLTVKPYIRQIQADDGVIIVDDSIAEKPHTDENAIICALELAPNQIRIGSRIARPPERGRSPRVPEVARVYQGQIVVERWNAGEQPGFGVGRWRLASKGWGQRLGSFTRRES